MQWSEDDFFSHGLSVETLKELVSLSIPKRRCGSPQQAWSPPLSPARAFPAMVRAPVGVHRPVRHASSPPDTVNENATGAATTAGLPSPRARLGLGSQLQRGGPGDDIPSAVVARAALSAQRQERGLSPWGVAPSPPQSPALWAGSWNTGCIASGAPAPPPPPPPMMQHQQRKGPPEPLPPEEMLAILRGSSSPPRAPSSRPLHAGGGESGGSSRQGSPQHARMPHSRSSDALSLMQQQHRSPAASGPPSPTRQYAGLPETSPLTAYAPPGVSLRAALRPPLSPQTPPPAMVRPFLDLLNNSWPPAGAGFSFSLAGAGNGSVQQTQHSGAPEEGASAANDSSRGAAEAGGPGGLLPSLQRPRGLVLMPEAEGSSRFAAAVATAPGSGTTTTREGSGGTRVQQSTLNANPVDSQTRNARSRPTIDVRSSVLGPVSPRPTFDREGSRSAKMVSEQLPVHNPKLMLDMEDWFNPPGVFAGMPAPACGLFDRGDESRSVSLSSRVVQVTAFLDVGFADTVETFQFITGPDPCHAVFKFPVPPRAYVYKFKGLMGERVAYTEAKSRVVEETVSDSDDELDPEGAEAGDGNASDPDADRRGSDTSMDGPSSAQGAAVAGNGGGAAAGAMGAVPPQAAGAPAAVGRSATLGGARSGGRGAAGRVRRPPVLKLELGKLDAWQTCLIQVRYVSELECVGDRVEYEHEAQWVPPHGSIWAKLPAATDSAAGPNGSLAPSLPKPRFRQAASHDLSYVITLVTQGRIAKVTSPHNVNLRPDFHDTVAQLSHTSVTKPAKRTTLTVHLESQRPRRSMLLLQECRRPTMKQDGGRKTIALANFLPEVETMAPAAAAAMQVCVSAQQQQQQQQQAQSGAATPGAQRGGGDFGTSRPLSGVAPPSPRPNDSMPRTPRASETEEQPSTQLTGPQRTELWLLLDMAGSPDSTDWAEQTRHACAVFLKDLPFQSGISFNVVACSIALPPPPPTEDEIRAAHEEEKAVAQAESEAAAAAAAAKAHSGAGDSAADKGEGDDEGLGGSNQGDEDAGGLSMTITEDDVGATNGAADRDGEEDEELGGDGVDCSQDGRRGAVEGQQEISAAEDVDDAGSIGEGDGVRLASPPGTPRSGTDAAAPDDGNEAAAAAAAGSAAMSPRPPSLSRPGSSMSVQPPPPNLKPIRSKAAARDDAGAGGDTDGSHATSPPLQAASAGLAGPDTPSPRASWAAAGGGLGMAVHDSRRMTPLGTVPSSADPAGARGVSWHGGKSLRNRHTPTDTRRLFESCARQYDESSLNAALEWLAGPLNNVPCGAASDVPGTLLSIVQQPLPAGTRRRIVVFTAAVAAPPLGDPKVKELCQTLGLPLHSSSSRGRPSSQQSIAQPRSPNPSPAPPDKHADSLRAQVARFFPVASAAYLWPRSAAVASRGMSPPSSPKGPTGYGVSPRRGALSSLDTGPNRPSSSGKPASQQQARKAAAAAQQQMLQHAVLTQAQAAGAAAQALAEEQRDAEKLDLSASLMSLGSEAQWRALSSSGGVQSYSGTGSLWPAAAPTTAPGSPALGLLQTRDTSTPLNAWSTVVPPATLAAVSRTSVYVLAMGSRLAQQLRSLLSKATASTGGCSVHALTGRQVQHYCGKLRRFVTAERYLLQPKVTVHQAVLRSLVPATLPAVLLPDQPLQVLAHVADIQPGARLELTAKWPDGTPYSMSLRLDPRAGAVKRSGDALAVMHGMTYVSQLLHALAQPGVLGRRAVILKNQIGTVAEAEGLLTPFTPIRQVTLQRDLSKGNEVQYQDQHVHWHSPLLSGHVGYKPGGGGAGAGGGGGGGVTSGQDASSSNSKVAELNALRNARGHWAMNKDVLHVLLATVVHGTSNSVSASTLNAEGAAASASKRATAALLGGRPEGVSEDQWATILVLAYLRKFAADELMAWQGMAAKAWQWLCASWRMTTLSPTNCVNTSLKLLGKSYWTAS